MISNFADADAHWFLLPSTISALLGGFPAILLTSFCYVADITDSQSRAWRLGFLDFVLFGGQLVGLVVSPVLFRRFGYCVVFATSAFGCLLGLLYSYFLLMETIYIISVSMRSSDVTVYTWLAVTLKRYTEKRKSLHLRKVINYNKRTDVWIRTNECSFTAK